MDLKTDNTLVQALFVCFSLGYFIQVSQVRVIVIVSFIVHEFTDLLQCNASLRTIYHVKFFTYSILTFEKPANKSCIERSYIQILNKNPYEAMCEL